MENGLLWEALFPIAKQVSWLHVNIYPFVFSQHKAAMTVLPAISLQEEYTRWLQWPVRAGISPDFPFHPWSREYTGSRATWQPCYLVCKIVTRQYFLVNPIYFMQKVDRPLLWRSVSLSCTRALKILSWPGLSKPNRSPAKRVRFGKEERRNEWAMTFW